MPLNILSLDVNKFGDYYLWFRHEKTKTYLLILGLVILSGIFSPGYGSVIKSNLRFQYLTTDEGLAQNTVDCIFQDSFGFMWFGTWNGLCRYDGYNFRTFQKRDSPKSLPDNFVRALCEDDSGNLWIGTASGVVMYNLKNETFNLPDNLRPSLEKIAVTSFFCDDKGAVWIGAEKGNLYCVTQKSVNMQSSFDFLKIDTQKLQEADITSVYVMKNGRVIIGSAVGLYVAESGKLKKLSFPGSSSAVLESVNIHCIYESAIGDCWFGAENGLYWYNQSEKRMTFYNTQTNSRLDHAIVMAIAEDSSGTILVGTLGGVNFFNPNAFNNHTGWVGISHCGVFQNPDSKEWYYTSQGRLPENVPGINASNAIMMGYVCEIIWTEDGWPVVMPERYAAVPQLPMDAKAVAGNYEVIVMEYQYKTIQKSATLLLLTNGTAFGAFTGQWTLDAEKKVLQIGNQKLLISDGYDWERSPRKATLVFSGLTSTGRPVWGKMTR